MISISKYGNSYNRNISEIVGLSTDEKPTKVFENVNIINGSTFLEMDTGSVFIYDEQNHKWYKM